MIQLLCMLALAATADGLATEHDYKIVADGTKLKAGTPGTLVVTVVAQNGFKVSQETPFSVKLAPPEGIKLGATQFQRKDLVDPASKEPQLKTSIAADKKGEHTLKSDLVFFLCTDKLCQRMTAKHDIKVAVD